MSAIKDDEIILNSSSEVDRRQRFEAATEEVFERWHNVFVELAKSENDENEDSEKANDESHNRK